MPSISVALGYGDDAPAVAVFDEEVHHPSAEFGGVARGADDGDAARVEDGPQCGNRWIHESVPSITLPHSAAGSSWSRPIIAALNVTQLLENTLWTA